MAIAAATGRARDASQRRREGPTDQAKTTDPLVDLLADDRDPQQEPEERRQEQDRPDRGHAHVLGLDHVLLHVELAGGAGAATVVEAGERDVDGDQL